MPDAVNWRPAGDRAVLLECASLEEVHAWRAALTDAAIAGVEDLVAGYSTLLVVGSQSAQAAVAELLDNDPPARNRGHSDHVTTIPVSYDGEDLDEVAELTGLSTDEVVERHTAPTYTVAFLGFLPGFPYLVGLDPALRVPRRPTPRTAVAAGSVGLAAGQTGIYPVASPGGWQLIGHTPAVLFDPMRDQPALLSAGDQLRFTSETVSFPHPKPAARWTSLTSADGRPALEVVQPGPLTTVQDLGRPGLAHLGVPRAGAVDAAALRRANAAVGNPDDAAALEATLIGPTLRALSDVTIALSGGHVAHPMDAPFTMRTGDILTVGPVRPGLRTYVAVAGGLASPVVLGSRSTDTLSGLGPAPLRAGDTLAVGSPPTQGRWPLQATAVAPPALRVRPGPRHDAFDRDALRLLEQAQWTVTAASDRTAARLAGPVLARRNGAGEFASEGVVEGALQVPADGQPILLLANHPTTGGYPVIAVVVADDLSLIAQARPGSTLRFRVDSRGLR